ncbi:hypothetical protein QR680_015132 [Steinernema hermaphroditum]|uniref:Calponin-homology (CH) domain-containing protein n=1 Tax=Steinernema hermaphroditum TaxID=289476 RepID=A0AA39IDV0_9BILA|nr:hypothetical protein QR680_015132 [Steinernema hermaphroditum]
MSTRRQTVPTTATSIWSKPSRFLASSTPTSSTRSFVSTENWTVRNPVTSSRFLSSASTTPPRRAPPTTAEFISQHVERERDHYKEQAKKAEDLLAKLQEILRYDVGEPRFFGPGNSNRTPILSDDLLTKVTHIQEGFYCAKEELEALWQEFEELQLHTEGAARLNMLHEQRLEDDLKGAKIAIAKMRNDLTEIDGTETLDEISDFESYDSHDYDPTPNDLKTIVEWQNEKIARLKRERDLMKDRFEVERAEMEQFKKDMLLSVRVAEQFRKEAEHEAKILRLQVERLTADANHIDHYLHSPTLDNAPDRVVKPIKEDLLPIWTLLKKERPLGSRRNAFLEWCKDRVSPYEIEVQNFSSHWNDGRAFAALLHSFNSTYMHPSKMSKSTSRGNIEYILNVAVRLKVPEEYILSPSRLLREKPNWQDVMEFTAQLYVQKYHRNLIHLPITFNFQWPMSGGWGTSAESDWCSSPGANKLDDLVESLTKKFGSDSTNAAALHEFIAPKQDSSGSAVSLTRKSNKPNSAPKILKHPNMVGQNKNNSNSLRRVTFEVEKFAASQTADRNERDSAMAQLAMSLGAKPKKNKAVNYKKLKEERAQVKTNSGGADKHAALMSIQKKAFKKNGKKQTGKKSRAGRAQST